MKVHSVHSREIGAPAEEVGALLDGLGGEHDRLWPTERWPTTPFELNGPLAVGTRSRQGQIRQAVEAHEPGRRLVLRFAPGLGLVGRHRLEVEALGPDRSRMTHSLECRVEPRMLALYPILIRQHDALVEDLLDRAELATTGRVERPARWPASVRIANAAEVLIARRRGELPHAHRAPAGRLAALAVPPALVALAALHAAWALGSPWPAGSERELAERVLSRGERLRLDGGLPPRRRPGLWRSRSWPRPASSARWATARARARFAARPGACRRPSWSAASPTSPPTSSAASTTPTGASTWRSIRRCPWPSAPARRWWPLSPATRPAPRPPAARRRRPGRGRD